MKKHHMLSLVLCLLAVSTNSYAMKVKDYLELVNNKCKEYGQKFPVYVRAVNNTNANPKPYCQKKDLPDSQHKILAIYFKKGLLLKLLYDPNYVSQIFLLRRANQELECIKQCKHGDNCADYCGDHCVDCLYTLFEKPVSLSKAKYYYNQIFAVEGFGISEPLYYKCIL